MKWFGLCIKVGRGQGDGDIGTGTLGRVYGDSGLGDARRRTWGPQVWDVGTCGTGTWDVKYKGAGTSNTGTQGMWMIIAKVGGKCHNSHFRREYVLVNAAHPTLIMVPIFQKGDLDKWFHFLWQRRSSPRYSSWRISKVRLCCVCLDYDLNPNTSLLDSFNLIMSRYHFQNLSTKTTT